MAKTRAENMVETLFCSCVIAMLMAGCVKDADGDTEAQSGIRIEMPADSIKTYVNIYFSEPYYDVTPMTRAALSTVATRLDIWITDGVTTQAIHQQSTDGSFGAITLSLNKTKTYTLYAVGHKCDAEATLSDGVIAWAEDKVKDTFWYTTTFSPADVTAINAQMSRIVALFRLETTDAVPTDVKKIRITQRTVYDRWHIATGATHQTDRISTIAITSTAQDGTVALSVYSIVTDTPTLHDITAEALDASDQIIQSHVFTDVPLCNGYKTTYRGAFFTSQGVSMTFTAGDWCEYDTTVF